MGARSSLVTRHPHRQPIRILRNPAHVCHPIGADTMDLQRLSSNRHGSPGDFDAAAMDSRRADCRLAQRRRCVCACCFSCRCGIALVLWSGAPDSLAPALPGGAGDTASAGMAALEPALPPGEATRSLIRRLDAFLRSRQRIFEFSNHPHCLLRVSVTECKRPVRLEDGTELTPGDAIGELHLYNDHLPIIPADGPGVAWANEAQRHLRESLRRLALSLETDSRLRGVLRVPRCDQRGPKRRNTPAPADFVASPLSDDRHRKKILQDPRACVLRKFSDCDAYLDLQSTKPAQH